MEKLIITAAVTGAFLSKDQHSALPTTPEEIRDEVKRCYDAGASIAHIHARHPDRKLNDYEVLGSTLETVHEACPIITQLGTGVRDRFGEIRTEEERLQFFNISPLPDMMTINAGTFHFRIISKKGAMGSQGRSYIYSNSPKLIADFAKGFYERGIGIEFECFDAGQVENVKLLKDTGVLPSDYHFNFDFVMGVGGGMPATPKALMYLVDSIPEGSHWCAMAISRHQAPITTMATVLGGSVRVGFEDNVYLYRGVLADTNAQFVERAVKIAREIGREVATVEEARETLKLKPRN
jgi:3-keto-5-aminohexanoate cleavage enzyme